MDTQCRTRKYNTSMTSKTLSTALRDKEATYNRLRKAKPITSRERDPLNRTGHVIAGSPGMHFTSRTFKLGREPPKQKQSVSLLKHKYSRLRCRTSKYENFSIVSPSRT